jgi:hypothetical protein
MVKEKMANKSKKNDYDQMHIDLMDMILSGQMHSTLIGKTVAVGSKSDKNLKEIEDFVEYIVNLLKKSEQFRKDNVKKSKK